jgi:hypothetical protein
MRSFGPDEDPVRLRATGNASEKETRSVPVGHLHRGDVDWLLENAGSVEIEDVAVELRAVDRQV